MVFRKYTLQATLFCITLQNSSVLSVENIERCFLLFEGRKNQRTDIFRQSFFLYIFSALNTMPMTKTKYDKNDL